MANLGTFRKAGHEYTGEIVTLSLQARNVRLIPETRAAGENAPSHRVYVGRAEIGAAWNKVSTDGQPYLGLKLDDPSFNRPSMRASSTTRMARPIPWSGPGRNAATPADLTQRPPRPDKPGRGSARPV